MKKEDLLKLKTKLKELSTEEKKLRDLYLKGLSNGEIYGPPIGYMTIDKPWLKYYSDETILMDSPRNTIYGYIKDRNFLSLDRIAIEYFNVKLTYYDLIEKIDECANALEALGVKKGEVITLCMPTTPETVFMFYACSKIGAIANMIDPRKSASEIEEYINETNSKIFMGVSVAKEKYANIRNNTCCEMIIISTPYDSFNKSLRYILNKKDEFGKKSSKIEYITWNKFISLGKGIYSLEVKYEENMPVAIVHTGGTTGKAKGVILSNDNINNGAFQCEISGLDFKDKGTWLDIMPPFIAYGVGNGLHLPLSMGMKVILMPNFDPMKYDDILLKHRPNYMAGVPSHYGYLLDSKKLDGVDLSFIKTPIVGGDKMDYTLEEKVNEFLKEHNCGTKIIKGYGMSEVNAAVSVCINGDINRLKSVGIPLSKSLIGVFDPETGEELRSNEHGEIRITGPNVMVGYYDNEDEEKKILQEDEVGNRWIYSGDSGYMDEDGFLYVDGRYKEMIIRSDGFKVYPNSIEDVILKHKDVLECKVVGCRDFKESQGELPKAFIILRKECINPLKTLKEIEEICHIHLAEYSLPYDYEFVSEFPKTAVGKIDTLALKEKEENFLKTKIKLLKKN